MSSTCRLSSPHPEAREWVPRTKSKRYHQNNTERWFALDHRCLMWERRTRPEPTLISQRYSYTEYSPSQRYIRWSTRGGPLQYTSSVTWEYHRAKRRKSPWWPPTMTSGGNEHSCHICKSSVYPRWRATTPLEWYAVWASYSAIWHREWWTRALPLSLAADKICAIGMSTHRYTRPVWIWTCSAHETHGESRPYWSTWALRWLSMSWTIYSLSSPSYVTQGICESRPRTDLETPALSSSTHISHDW